MISIPITIVSIVAAVNVILSVVIFSRGVKHATNILFGLIGLASAVWSLAIIGFYSSYQALFNWTAITHISAIAIAFFFLAFSMYFPQKMAQTGWPVVLSAIPLLIISYLLATSKIIIGETSGLSYAIHEGYVLYALIFTGYFIFGFLFLYKQYKQTPDPLQKKQILYVFFGSLLASVAASIPDLVLPYLKVFRFTWLGPIFTLIMVVSLFLAMLRYRLFNIKIILTEIVSILIVIALLVELFLAQSASELILKSAILVIVTIFSFILIRGVYREVALREEKEHLAVDLATANVHLKELDQLKTEFLSLASHQIRAPITAIKGYASLLMEGNYGTLPPEAKEAVNVIFSSGQNMALMVDDFLNISRIEQGRMTYQFADTDFVELVRSVVTELKPTADKRGLAFEFIIDSSIKMKGTGGSLPPLHIWADTEKLRQVVLNIIDNSIKYTPKGSVKVIMSHNQKEGMARFQVSDTGIGISSSTILHLFEKFVRAKNAIATNVSGTGLGLYLAKQIVVAHKGRIWVSSEGEGKGTTFYVEIPEK